MRLREMSAEPQTTDKVKLLKRADLDAWSLLSHAPEKRTTSAYPIRRFREMYINDLKPPSYQIQRNRSIKAQNRVRRKHKTFLLMRLESQYPHPHI